MPVARHLPRPYGRHRRYRRLRRRPVRRKDHGNTRGRVKNLPRRIRKLFGGNNARKYQYIGKRCRRNAAGGPTECACSCMLAVASMPARSEPSALSTASPVDLSAAGCACVNTCPKDNPPVPYYADVNVACSSTRRALRFARSAISAASAANGRKTCQYDAIHVGDNLARIDYENAGCVSVRLSAASHVVDSS